MLFNNSIRQPASHRLVNHPEAGKRQARSAINTADKPTRNTADKSQPPGAFNAFQDTPMPAAGYFIDNPGQFVRSSFHL